MREAYRGSWFPWVPPIKQVVHSESKENVMRAMHAHKKQYDIWHFTSGTAFVQVYDILSGEHLAFETTPQATIAIPPGVAHGFLALTDLTLTYYLTEEYDGSDEFGFNAYDEDFPGRSLWPLREYGLTKAIRSYRDCSAPSFADFLADW